MNDKNGKILKNQLRGVHNKSVGEWFERYISAACDHYKNTGAAVIEKTPEPMRVISKGNAGRFTAVFEKKAQPDYKGVLPGGKAIVFEAKHTDNDKIIQSRVTKEQSCSLDTYSSLGAACYVLVSIKMKNFYLVPWDVWKNMKDLYGRKYMIDEELNGFRVPFSGGVIEFLNISGEEVK